MIYFIGAGPGAPDLISLRGARLLSQADMCIYAGSLVNPDLLDLCPPHCRIYNSATMTLEEVVARMQEAADQDALCVRLHTGDPSLYGAIREQIDQLKAQGIPFAVCPGISSFSAAAAALGVEYTLPEVSQSLIISRIAGRTPVPEKESLNLLAQHQTSLVIFLSAGHIDRVQAELLAGGYPPETPAVLAYKVSWPEEKTFACTVATLAETAAREGIENFALILVGNFLAKDYARSKLYDPDFATSFRQVLAPSCLEQDSSQADPSFFEQTPSRPGPSFFGTSPSQAPQVSILSFSEQGQFLAKQIVTWVESHGAVAQAQRCPDGGLQAWTAEHFEQSSALIFVGASGIAVRAISPYLHAKTIDPAVLVVDETGQFVIPLVSGHLGGANQLAEELAEALKATAVVTTATDRCQLWAVDNWTRAYGYHILNPEAIKRVSSRILAGQGVKIYSDFPIKGKLPLCLTETKDPSEADIYVSWKDAGGQGRAFVPNDCISPCSPAREVRVQAPMKPSCLRILVPSVVVGVGCQKGVPAALVSQAIEKALDRMDCNPLALCGLASIDLKAKEAGILEANEFWNLPYVTFTADQLKNVPGDFHHSDFVEKITGVDNVAERAAVLAAKQGQLIQPRLAGEGVTVALALKKVTLTF